MTIPTAVEKIMGPCSVVRSEESPDGTTTYFLAAPERSALEHLRGNNRSWDGLMVPAVIDPETSVSTLRLVLSPLEQARLGRAGTMTEDGQERELRLAVGAPRSGPHRFGRSGRLGVEFGRPSVFSCRIFNHFLAGDLEEPNPRLKEALSRIMLARSGVGGRPAFYYRLTADSIASLEVCARAPNPVSAARTRELARMLAARAVDDYSILATLLETQETWGK